MGETTTFSAPAGSATGYLAVSAGGVGPGVLVVQEWWGLVPQIRGVCDRLAAAGFTALAPDLYRGAVATHAEPDWSTLTAPVRGHFAAATAAWDATVAFLGSALSR